MMRQGEHSRGRENNSNNFQLSWSVWLRSLVSMSVSGSAPAVLLSCPLFDSASAFLCLVVRASVLCGRSCRERGERAQWGGTGRLVRVVPAQAPGPAVADGPSDRLRDKSSHLPEPREGSDEGYVLGDKPPAKAANQVAMTTRATKIEAADTNLC